MNRTAPHLPLLAHQDSGSVPLTKCVLTWTSCAMARGTVPMEQTSHLSAVSIVYHVYASVRNVHKKK